MYSAAMGAALAQHDAVLRAVMSAAAGAVFQATGNGGYAVFASVAATLEAAELLQIRLGDEAFSAVDGLKLRMGAHSDPAGFRDDDYFGPFFADAIKDHRHDIIGWTLRRSQLT
ncbi:MAG TPA: hypothetical protein PK677_14810 [Acidiphilium sp.]|nr:MAG: hypothetical protein B7Z57_13640 [Acidiphilium sp. 37-60-79]HQT89792.1 hypothetical protein [Acidiphilium sp.]